MTSQKMLTVAQVAEMTNYAEKTIRKWCRQGIIRAVKVRTIGKSPKSTPWRIPESEVQRLFNDAA